MIAQRFTVPLAGALAESAAAALERALSEVSGVILAYVNPSTEMAYVSAADLLAREELLVEAVERAGFAAGEPSRR